MATADKPLTPRQRQVFEFVRDQILNRGYGPTVREIGNEFEIKSPNGVMCHLKALEKKGLITRESNMSRAIQLAYKPPKSQSVAFLGVAVSGDTFHAALSSDEQVDFDHVLAGDDRGAIRVEGSACRSLGIIDGDHLIIERNSSGSAGNLVAALDDRHHMILCRVPDDGGVPVPAIDGGAPASNRRVLGVVVALIRSLMTGNDTTSPVNENTNGTSSGRR